MVQLPPVTLLRGDGAFRRRGQKKDVTHWVPALVGKTETLVPPLSHLPVSMK